MQFMKAISVNIAIITVLLLNLSGCSTIKGYFPDKEKDYQLSSELPALKIPADISSKGLTKKHVTMPVEDTESETVVVMGEMLKAPPVAAGSTQTISTESQKREPTRVELVKFSNGETRLQINKSVAMSWRMIGKALTGKGIEITARDQANGEFSVQYDPNETDFKDEDFLDELDFVFDKNHSQEKPFHIKILSRDKIAEVVVLDGQGKLLSDGSGLSLLKLLATTLQANLADE